MNYVDRSGWLARAATRPPVLFRLPARRVRIHHAAAELHGRAGVRAIQTLHQDVRGWRDIGYHALVDDDGTVFEGCGLEPVVVGSHTAGANSTELGVCFLGNFTRRPLARPALEAAAELIAGWVTAGMVALELGVHHDAPGAATACPGAYVDRALFALEARVRELVHPTPTPEVDDVTTLAPTWARTHANGRLEFYRHDRGSRTVVGYNGAPLDVDHPWRHDWWDQANGIAFATLDDDVALAAPLVGIVEGPDGRIYAVAEDGGTFHIADPPAPF